MIIRNYLRKRKIKKCSDEDKVGRIKKAQEDIIEKSSALIPELVLRYIGVQWCIAAIVFIASVALVLTTKDLYYMIGFVFVLYLAYKAISIANDCKSGHVHEHVLLCSSVNKKIRSVQIIMQDVTATPVVFYEFFYPKKNCPFFPEQPYLVYTSDKDPHQILTWVGI